MNHTDNTVSYHSGSGMVINMDCLEALKSMDDNMIDVIITDPPYGYSFMGKDWDKAVPLVKIWKECLRVLKPGSWCMVMSAPRQDVLSQMIVRLGEAGFDTSFTSIYWTYSSGFPKAHNISKAIDKKLGAERKVVGEKISPDGIPYSKRIPPQNEKQWNDYSATQYDNNITEPATPEAKKFDGYYGGFQPKPAVEVVIVCQKPLDQKTFADQALANGKGGVWMDDCRIPYAGESDVWVTPQTPRSNVEFKLSAGNEERPDANPQGRFPANLLVSDDVLNDGRITKSSGDGSRFINKDGVKTNVGHKLTRGSSDKVVNINTPSDSGSYSRYFSLDQWDEKARSVFPFIICPKASKKEKNAGLSGDGKKVRDNRQAYVDNPFQRGETLRQNTHPCVKPLKLMRYLITLTTREGDVVLDPFAGSGTTLVAAKQLNRKYVGCELSAEYYNIINARLSHYDKSEAA